MFFLFLLGRTKNPKKQVRLSGKIKSANSTHSCVILEVTPNLILRSNLQETLYRHIQEGHVNKSHERGIGNMALQHFKIIYLLFCHKARVVSSIFPLMPF